MGGGGVGLVFWKGRNYRFLVVVVVVAGFYISFGRERFFIDF